MSQCINAILTTTKNLWGMAAASKTVHSEASQQTMTSLTFSKTLIKSY